MQINVTFLIQIANFWFFYVVFSRFFLRPIVKQVHKKAVLDETALSALKEKENFLAHLQQDKKTNQEVFRRFIKKQYPAPVPVFKQIPTIDVLPCSRDEMVAFSKITCDLFVKKACDAF